MADWMETVWYAHHLVPISLCPGLARGASSETSMIRIWITGSVLVLALNVPAAAQQRSVPEILERLHRLCDQDYKPACIKLGLVIGKLPPATERKLRRDHPEWWWWLRW
jgi:hypothetical protein